MASCQMEASTARVRGTYVPALANPSVRAAKVKLIISTTTCPRVELEINAKSGADGASRHVS